MDGPLLVRVKFHRLRPKQDLFASTEGAHGGATVVELSDRLTVQLDAGAARLRHNEGEARGIEVLCDE